MLGQEVSRPNVNLKEFKKYAFTMSTNLGQIPRHTNKTKKQKVFMRQEWTKSVIDEFTENQECGNLGIRIIEYDTEI